MKRGARWNRCVEQTSQKMTALSLSRFQYAKLPPGAIDGAFLGDLFYALSPHAVHVLGLSDPAAEWKCVWQVPPHRRYVPGYSREAFLKSAPPDRKPHLQFYRLYATAAHLFVLTEWEPVAPAKAVDATPGRLNSKRIFRIDGPELVPVNTPFSAPFDVRCDDADFFVRKDGVVYEYDAAGRMVARIAFHVGKPGGVVVTRLDGSEPAEQVFALADLSGAEIQRVDFQRRMVLAFTSASRIVAYNAATKQVVPGLSPCHRHLGAGSRMACGALPGTLGVHLGLRTDTYDLKEVDVKKLAGRRLAPRAVRGREPRHRPAADDRGGQQLGPPGVQVAARRPQRLRVLPARPARRLPLPAPHRVLRAPRPALRQVQRRGHGPRAGEARGPVADMEVHEEAHVTAEQTLTTAHAGAHPPRQRALRERLFGFLERRDDGPRRVHGALPLPRERAPRRRHPGRHGADRLAGG